jgi:type 1 glutamine amidotransferase
MKALAFALTLLLMSLTPVSAALAVKSAKVLFLVGGLYHDYDQLPATLSEKLKSNLKDQVSLDFTISKDLASLQREELKKYDVLILNLCEQTELTPEEKEGFLSSVKAGLPVVALHCTFWCFQSWPEFKHVLGAFVPGHQKFGPICLKTVQPGNPILDGIPSQFEMTDEPYLVNERDPAMNVLVRTCAALPDRPDPEPEVWTKEYSKGRIFAMTFGHDAQAQNGPVYLRLLGNGLLWALNLTK